MSYRFLLGWGWKFAALVSLTSALALSAVIYDSGSTALNATDPTQAGRLNHNGIPSDWSSLKAFPGTSNPTTFFRYQVFDIPASPFPYLQISFDDIAGTTVTFASAYSNSYAPSSTAPNAGLNINYLGDAGSSGNYYSTDPRVFQVVLPSPATDHLVVVVNDTTGTTNALNQDFRILVEGFYDTNYNDTTPPTPEPSTILLSGVGFTVAFAVYRRQRKDALIAPKPPVLPAEPW